MTLKELLNRLKEQNLLTAGTQLRGITCVVSLLDEQTPEQFLTVSSNVVNLRNLEARILKDCPKYYPKWAGKEVIYTVRLTTSQPEQDALLAANRICRTLRLKSTDSFDPDSEMMDS